MTEGNSMTKSERDSLAKLVRARAKVAKNEIESHTARIMATVEAQLAARYPENHPAWAEITEHANRAVTEANDYIARRCRELGIPERFRPSINYYWSGRGENAFNDRRAELRRAAKTELAARVKTAKNTVDRRMVDLLTQLAAGMLESSQAKNFLAAIPAVDDLMPPITLDALEAIAPSFTLGGGW
jgi:hypothetical protein